MSSVAIRVVLWVAAAALFFVVVGALLTGTGAITGSCTGWFDGDWKACCDAHDVAYADGTAKFAADLDLAHCIAVTGHAGMALVMFAAVSLFGGIFYRRRR